MKVYLLLVVCLVLFAQTLHAQTVQWKSLGGPKKTDGTYQAIRKIIVLDQGSILAFGAGLYRSDDKGATWTKLSNARDVAFDTDSVMFAAGDDGVFSSTNFGVTWKDLNDQLPGGPFNNIVVTPHGALVTCRNYDLYRSSDRGISWDRVGDNIPISSGQMQMAGTPKGALIADLNYQSYRSVDEGLTWKAVSRASAEFTTVRPSVLLATSTEGHVARSTNDGVSWQDVSVSNFSDYAFGKAAIDIVGRTYVGSSHFSGNGVLVMSKDSGLTWTSLGTCPDIWCLAFGPDNELYAGTYRTGIARTLKPISAVAARSRQVSTTLMLPNPVLHWVQIPQEFSQSEGTIFIFDLLGRRILESPIQERIGVSELPNGCYLLRIKSSHSQAQTLLQVCH